MPRLTRREFLESGTVAAAVGIGFTGPEFEPLKRTQRADDAGPDLVVVNGRVYTVDESLPIAEAFAVKHDRIVAVGSTSDISNLVTRNTEVFDAGGKTVTPGFIDAHSHPANGGISELLRVNLDLRSITEIQGALRERASNTPPGEWVVGFKYDDTKVREGRRLTRRDLDEAVPNHPVQVTHRGGHTSWYNSNAFELAGITANTPDPPGGQIYRDGDELNGLVAELARRPLQRLIPSGTTREQRQAGVKLITEMMSAAGLTSTTDAGCSPQYTAAYQDAYDAGELCCRISMMMSGGSTYQSLRSAGFHTGMGNEWLRVGGAKYFADGSASERTMRMSTPYVGRPDDFGILTMTQEEIHEAVEEAHRSRWQVGIHANGDVAIDMVLNAYERVQANWPRPDPRHRLEHCSLVNPELLRRIKAVGAIPTPFYTYAHYHGNKWVEYGAEKMQWMFAHRSFLDYGIPVASGSDYVPGPYEPLMALQSMVTRKDFDGRVWGPNQRISVDEALRICTINAAHASFEEGIKGSIAAGKLGDFVILSEDPHAVNPDHIKEIQVVRTVVGGRTVFEA